MAPVSPNSFANSRCTWLSSMLKTMSPRGSPGRLPALTSTIGLRPCVVTHVWLWASATARPSSDGTLMLWRMDFPCNACAMWCMVSGPNPRARTIVATPASTNSRAACPNTNWRSTESNAHTMSTNSCAEESFMAFVTSQNAMA